jgi:hypothetical protein
MTVLLALCAVAYYATMAEWLRILLVVVGVLPILIVCPFALKIEQTAGYYECRKCGHRHVPTYSSVFFAMHTGRTRYMKCPKWYVRMMEFFAPTPDLIISLERPASDIYSQKPELDIEEIEREQAMVRKYLGKRKQTKIVDASHGVEATIAAVIKEVESWISSR